MNISNESIVKDLTILREKNPLVHNITNYVVMNFTANILLASGASPVMAHAIEEVEDMVSIASALVINIGTLSPPWVESMIKAGKAAAKKGIPVILDPVGVGATPYRTDTAKKIIDECDITVIRGNASEILSLRDSSAGSKGVDSMHSIDTAENAAVAMANELNITVAVTGDIDLVTDGTGIVRIQNGHPLMGKVTGTGCSASAITAAFAAINDDALAATAAALTCFGIAGELASKHAEGPGTFTTALIDALYNLSTDDINRLASITIQERRDI